MALTPVKKLSEVGNRLRKTFSMKTLLLSPNASETFVLEVGKSAIIQRLEVDKACVVEVFGTPTHDPLLDKNPYTFLATPERLVEDGSTVLRDGTIIQTRQYSIFTNLESPPKPQVYGRITNNQSVAAAITIKFMYLTVED